jgi:hypothetical protein
VADGWRPPNFSGESFTDEKIADLGLLDFGPIVMVPSKVV